MSDTVSQTGPRDCPSDRGTAATYKLVAPWFAFGIGVAGSVPAQAQMVGSSLATAAEANAVTARSNLNFNPAGIPLGPFRLHASADGNVAYDDNVYDTAALRLSDVITTITPRIEAADISPGHDLVLAAQGIVQRFGKLTAENNEQYSLTADGRLNIARPFTLAASAFYGLHSELRGTLGDIVVGAPDQFHLGGAKATATAELVNLVLTIGGGVASFDYRPVVLGGTRFAQGYRDRTVYTGEARAELQVGSGIRAFTAVNLDWQDYKLAVSANQNSHGLAAIGGIDFGVTQLISGEIGVGYLSQSYAAGGLRPIGGATYRAKLVWNVTTLLTATVNGARTLQPSPFLNQSGVLEDSFGVHLDYELLRKIIVTFDESGTLDDFRGIDRHDKRYVTAIGARYLVNRRFAASLQFSHRDQASRGAFARPYVDNNVSLSITAKL